MKVVSLAEVSELITDGTHGSPVRTRHGVPVLSAQNIKNGRLSLSTDRFTTADELRAFEARVKPRLGDVLLTIVGTIGRAAEILDPPNAVFQRSVAVIRPIRNVLDSRYLFHVTQSEAFSDQLRRATNQSSQAGVYLGKLKSLTLPLPSMKDQRRIAAILDQADALRANRHETLVRLDDLTRSIFLSMFGNFAGPFRTVDEIAATQKGSIRTGPFGSQLLHSEFADDGIAVLGIDNVVTNEFRWAGRRFITAEKYAKLKRYTVLPGDVLITIMGTCGRCAIVPTDVPTAINTKHICAITVDSSKVLPEFLRACFLWHPASRRYLLRSAKGAIMDGLNMGIVRAMPMPVPPLEVQRQFATAAAAIDNSRAHAMACQDQIEELLASLQAQVFGGGF